MVPLNASNGAWGARTDLTVWTESGTSANGLRWHNRTELRARVRVLVVRLGSTAAR